MNNEGRQLRNSKVPVIEMNSGQLKNPFQELRSFIYDIISRSAYL